jgi:hypothetical protein
VACRARSRLEKMACEARRRDMDGDVIAGQAFPRPTDLHGRYAARQRECQRQAWEYGCGVFDAEEVKIYIDLSFYFPVYSSIIFYSFIGSPILRCVFLILHDTHTSKVADKTNHIP